MDLSNFNLSTVLMLFLAISFAYVAIKFFSNVIGKAICFTIGVLLLIFVLTQLGITIPILSEVITYFFEVLAVVFENLKELLASIRG